LIALGLLAMANLIQLQDNRFERDFDIPATDTRRFDFHKHGTGPYAGFGHVP